MVSISRAMPFVIAVICSATPLRAQRVGFPWKAGDAPPPFAGFQLGQNLAKSRASMRGQVHTDTLGTGPSRGYAYTTKDNRLSLVGVPAEGVGIITVRRRNLGAVDGIRVGDACEAVIMRWGAPPSGDSEVAGWVAGKWLVSARCDTTGHVSELSVGNVG
jgi:hypothetical protein